MGTHSLPATALHTPLCDLLGIRYPIVQAGMAGATTPELVAAVSNAGGLGVFGAALTPPDRVREVIRAIKSLTDRPFGVNFQLAPTEQGNSDVAAVQGFFDHFREELGLAPGTIELTLPSWSLSEQLQVVFEEQVPVLSTGLGDPSELVEQAREAGALVMAMVTTVEEAVRVVKGGANVVVAQGAEAGGHRGTFEIGPGGEVPMVGTLALVPQVVDAVRAPVLAAGGIMDGRGLVAALALGAEGAMLGTQFVMAVESAVPPVYKEMMLAATEVDTIITHVLTGRPTRALPNHIIEEYLRSGPEPLGWPFQRIAAQDIYMAARERNDADYLVLQPGQGVRMLKAGRGATEIVAELVAEAEAVLQRLGDLAS